MAEFTSRIETILRSKLSAMLDNIENPRETLDLAFEEQRELLHNVRDGIDNVVAVKRRLQQREEDLRARAAELDQQAHDELAKGDDELARAALRAKTAIEAELDTVDDQIEDLDQDLAGLTKREQDVSAKFERLRTEQTAAVEPPSNDMTDLGLAMERAVDKMSSMNDRASRVEAAGDGPARARTDAPAEDPIRRLAELEAERSVDDQLNRMRRELESGDVRPD